MVLSEFFYCVHTISRIVGAIRLLIKLFFLPSSYNFALFHLRKISFLLLVFFIQFLNYFWQRISMRYLLVIPVQ
jgi:hypothetical protein